MQELINYCSLVKMCLIKKSYFFLIKFCLTSCVDPSLNVSSKFFKFFSDAKPLSMIRIYLIVYWLLKLILSHSPTGSPVKSNLKVEDGVLAIPSKAAVHGCRACPMEVVHVAPFENNATFSWPEK